MNVHLITMLDKLIYIFRDISATGCMHGNVKCMYIEQIVHSYYENDMWMYCTGSC
jgi:hypothetical protein